MTSLHTSLAEISSEYTIFEKDQILTEDQLNSVTQYLDDQDRLSRIHLTGVGLVCGLNVRRSGNTISLTQGLGITTDGDLVQLASNKSFNRFKAYSSEAPKYPPFFDEDDNRIALFELVETGVTDVLAQPLANFQASSGINFNNAAALLLVESYVKDHDLCSGTDCDNHSQQYVSQLKLLLLSSTDAASLATVLPTAQSAAKALQPLWADRVKITPSLNTRSEWNEAFATAIKQTQARIQKELPTLWSNCGFLFDKYFDSDPTTAWSANLSDLAARFVNTNTHLQYYNAFLTDIIHCWNELIELLITQTSWCVPQVSGFPKHLLLGDVVAANGNSNNNTNSNESDSAANNLSRRTAFYPAVANGLSNTLDEAAFLIHKISALIESFAPATANTLRVTPSYAAGGLQEKAIPCYYNATTGGSLPKYWNYKLYQLGKSAYSYGYKANSYGAQGPASSPLNAEFNQYDFFRVEGHFGQPFETIYASVEKLIADNNLPFSVYGVLLDGDKTKLRGKRGKGFTDLDRLHRLARADLTYRIEDVKQVGNNFKTNIFQSVDAGLIRNDAAGSDAPAVKEIASAKNTALTGKTNAALSKLNKSYIEFKKDKSWLDDVEEIKSIAGQFKADLSKVTATPHATAFDGMIVGTAPDWINWLDILIDDKNDKADDARVITNFVKAHPGLQPACGVVRGGTLVLVYDSNGNVVGDLMLSHHVEDAQDEPSEPPLVRPRPPITTDIIPGIKIIPSFDHLLIDKLNIFKADFDKEIQFKFDATTFYGEAMKESLTIVKDMYRMDANTAVGKEAALADGYLDAKKGLIESKGKYISYLDRELEKTTLPPQERDELVKIKETVQEDLANEITETAKYIENTNKPVTQGSDSAKVLVTMETTSLAIAGNTKAEGVLKTGLAGVGTSTNVPPEFAGAIGRITGRF
ncbi:hypothetical protein KO528_18800 [Saccharophagus degradans]|uniref:hypothetical protein n=1 Tax=Saccharophagus degradans TaxID=86304 RepID=UPI001C083BD3|nr:hypothetical protein [Saccharophagus degradans]MBU2987419.1 hypothetical protein [Saccharophagus degradans]